MKTIKLLLIEDDGDLGYIIKNCLEDVIGGYEVDSAYNGKEGLEHFKSFRPDVIVSDIEMPVLNGLEMVKKIRETDLEVPILFATAKNTSKDVTVGYDAGVDNYIKKPFTAEELSAHIKAVMSRKADGKSRVKEGIHKIGKYTFDPKNFILRSGNSEKKILTARESQILELLLENKGKIVKREDIIDRFWSNAEPFYASRSLDVFITKLRKYISDDASVSIKNVKTKGLILDFD